MKLYTVYDSKSEAYDRPWVSPSRGIAIRSLLDVLKDQNHPFTKWPGDFTLFEIGSFDEQKGTIETYDAKVNLGVMIELAGLNKDSQVSPLNIKREESSSKKPKEVSNGN